MILIIFKDSPNQSQFNQTNQSTSIITTNFINKEPFNEDIEKESCALYEGNNLVWRNLVFENIKQILNESKLLQSGPDENVIKIYLSFIY